MAIPPTSREGRAEVSDRGRIHVRVIPRGWVLKNACNQTHPWLRYAECPNTPWKAMVEESTKADKARIRIRVIPRGWVQKHACTQTHPWPIFIFV